MPCNTCTDEARCDRTGLCQDFARVQLQRPRICGECGGTGLEDVSGFGHLDVCTDCRGAGVLRRQETTQ